LCLYYIILFCRPVILAALVIWDGQRKNEPKLARTTDWVAGFNSPQGKASAVVRKMFVSDNDVIRNILFSLLEVVLE
jgi:hypothetical protein